ncbi:hypothetical protein HPP92_000320 [Vanilla planifolia]|uniref:Uncharacterized protein n=1 Tax=Vanilla planifolia TaxID=51239 RepID=A0A835RU83_VANPL|nr:hypothetical protein HPP92_000320 [Vanilla planifolia]
MGFKSLTLQMIPWCLHVSIPPEHVSGGETVPSPSVRLILSDGRVRVFRRAVGAEELMAAHPLHLICRSDSFFIGQKVPPLAAGDVLLPGQSYFLLPAPFFASVLSFVSLASSFSSCGGPSKLLLLRPFEIQKTAAGRLQLRVSEEFVDGLREELEKEYRELVVRARIWKPKLETIREERRRRVGGGGGLAGIRRKKKKNNPQKGEKTKP